MMNTVQILHELAIQKPGLHAELKRRSALRSAINNIHLQRLAKLQKWTYFTGLRHTGIDEMELNITDSMEDDDQLEKRDAFKTLTEFTLNISD
jgi:hypothetical protein